MDLSAGSARPIPAAIRRCASRVAFSLITVNATWPGWMCFNPSLREINLQFGGKIEETRTMLHAAIPALRKASSKLESRSRCFPTPFVRKIFFATNAMSGAGERCLLVCTGPWSRPHASCIQNSRGNFYACGKVTRTHHRVNQFPTLALNLCVTSIESTGAAGLPENRFRARSTWACGCLPGYSTEQSSRNFCKVEASEVKACKSLEVKSGPESDAECPLREIWTTPMTFFPSRMGALMIL